MLPLLQLAGPFPTFDPPLKKGDAYPEMFFREGNEIKTVKIDVHERSSKPKRGR
jgi:hypothetical protein